MATITYYFDELEIIKGCSMFAYGYAEITGSYCDAEPDVGIMHGYYEWDVHSISLQNSRDEGQTPIDRKHPLYDLIEEALRRDCDDSIDTELAESGTDGPDPDAYYEDQRDDREYQRKYG